MTLCLAQSGEQVPFDAAAAQMIEHLVGNAVGAVGNAAQLGHVLGVEIGHAPVAELAIGLELLEGGDRLGQRMRAAPVQQVEIDAVRLETLQAALAGGDGACARGVVRIDLADEEDLIAPARHGVGHDLLRPALAIHLGGIDEVRPRSRPSLQRPGLGGAIATDARPCARCRGRGPGSFRRRRA